MSARIGHVADKIMQLARQQGAPISVQHLNERLAEPIGLIHLGISQLVQEEKVVVVTRAQRNYIIAKSPPVGAAHPSQQLVLS